MEKGTIKANGGNERKEGSVPQGGDVRPGRAGDEEHGSAPGTVPGACVCAAGRGGGLSTGGLWGSAAGFAFTNRTLLVNGRFGDC